VVKRVDHRVAAATCNLGCEAGKQPTSEAAERRQQHQDPGPKQVRLDARGDRFSICPERRVTRELFEEHALKELQASEERGAGKTRGNTYCRGV
jgi:hypothetical protein